MEEIIKHENEYFRLCGGHIPEANEEWNNIQREKIAAVYEYNGKAYIGKINYYGEEREALTINSIFAEYAGQMIYNFEADFVVPNKNTELAEMIIKWNEMKHPLSLDIITNITNMVEKIDGLNLFWS